MYKRINHVKSSTGELSKECGKLSSRQSVLLPITGVHGQVGDNGTRMELQAVSSVIFVLVYFFVLVLPVIF